MDDKILGRAVEYHGPDFLRQLQLEQEKVPSNIFLHLQKHRPAVPEINDNQFILNVRRFISKKADILFQPIEKAENDIPDQTADEDSYAKMPPLETFMGIDPHTLRTHLYHSFEVNDIVVAVVTSILDTGLVLQLLCLDNDKNRDIDDLRISAFVPSKEIPQMFPTQNPVEGYQIKDYIRGVIVSVSPENESIILSLKQSALKETMKYKPTLGLIQKEDFPVQYRRKLHIRGLTFDELVNSIIGFSNPGNVPFLMDTLQQKHNTSLMRGLSGMKISEKDYADNLRKSQSQKWAYQCVAQGIHDFKKGRQTEAMQSFNKALQIDDTNVEALVARGALYANNESYTRALKDFEEALSLNHKHPNAIKYMHETLLAKGKCHEDDKLYLDAKKCYERAIEIMPDSQEAKDYLRYVDYKLENTVDKEKIIKKERSPSPVPYKDTTDKLKQLIQEDKIHSRSKSKSGGRSDDKQKKGRSPSPKKHRRRRSSSSSSSSGSRSNKYRRSTKNSRNKSRDRSPGMEHKVKKEIDGSMKVDPSSRDKDRDREKFEKAWSSGQRSISRERYETSKNEEPPTKYSMEDDITKSSYSKNKVSQVYSFSRSNEKIPGLGESPPDESRLLEHEAYKRLDKPDPDVDRSLYESKYRDSQPSSRQYSQRSPSWGREGSAAVSGSGKELRRRSSDIRKEEEKRHYEKMLDEELYGKSDKNDESKGYKVRNRSRSRSPSLSRSQNRSRPQHDRNESKLKIEKYEREESMTPTKDEVSDRLGLEDISSPEEQFHASDYRQRAYGSRERYVSHGDKSRTKDGNEYRGDSRKTGGRYSPSRKNRNDQSPDSFEDSPRNQRSRNNERSFKEERDNDIPVRRVISVTKKDKKMATPSPYDDNLADTRGRSPNDRQERRSIMIGGNREQVKLRESSPYDDKRTVRKSQKEKDGIMSISYDESPADHRRDRGRRESKNSRSRSGSPRRKKRGSVSLERDLQLSSSKRKQKIVSRSSRRSRSRSHSSHRSRSNSSQRSRSPRRIEKNKRSRSPYRSRSRHRSRSRNRSRSARRSHDRSRSPTHRKSKDKRVDTDYKDDLTKIQRVISVKPKQTVTMDDLPSPPEKSRSKNKEKVVLTREDIFADLPPPRENKDSLQKKFATYVPRAVKLKQAPVAINPESHPSITKHENKSEELKESRSVQVKSSEISRRSRQDRSPSPDSSKKSKIKPSKSREYSRSKSRSRSRSHDKNKLSNSSSKRNKRSRSRSRSPRESKSTRRSRSRHRSTSRSRHRSRSRSRRRSHSRKRSSPKQQGKSRRSRSRSGSRDRNRSKRGRSRHGSSSRSSSPDARSRVKRTTNDKKEVRPTSPKIVRNFDVNNVPTVSSRWDSPEEKRSRWGGVNNAPIVMPQSSVSQAQEEMANALAASLISKSPPPHRSMKPAEKAALKKKWKELSVSPILDQDDELPAVIKERLASVEKKLLMSESTSKTPGINLGLSTSALEQSSKNVNKMLKLRGIKSKWDSDSDRSRSKSVEKRSPVSKNVDAKKKSESHDRRKSEADKYSGRSKRSRSRSPNRGRRDSYGKKRRSRSRSRSRHRDRSKDRKYSSSSRKRSSSRDRSNKRKSTDNKDSKQENGKDKHESGKSKTKKDSRDNKSRSRSPKSKSIKVDLKSKWASDSESDHERDNKKPDVKEAPVDSLTALEKFYNELKNQKKQQVIKK